MIVYKGKKKVNNKEFNLLHLFSFAKNKAEEKFFINTSRTKVCQYDF